MKQDESTLQTSGIHRDGEGVAERVPGVMRLFGLGRAMAEAVPLREGALELGRGCVALGEAQDPRMSRRHARIEFDGRRFVLTDLGSQNGTYVDGERVPAGASREVQRLIRMGDSLFVPSADVKPLAVRGVERREGFVYGPAMQALLEEVESVARRGFPLHIHGESGAGKEGVARAYHARGPRKGGPFVAVNCATIPEGIAERLLFGARRGAYSGAEAAAEGYLQAADRGTLFLDEVVELELAVQAKLLRVLETREVLALGAVKADRVDIHICSASNKDMRALVAAGRLREDLYFRIGRPEVRLPPLRQRPEEVPLLLERQVQELAPGLGLHVSLVAECLMRPWPGNVRELLVEARSALQTALLQGAERVEARHLGPSAGTAFGPASTPSSPAPAPERRAPPSRTVDDEERERIQVALRQQGGNVAATARALGMHRTQLRRLLERYAIEVSAGDGEA